MQEVSHSLMLPPHSHWDCLKSGVQASCRAPKAGQDFLPEYNILSGSSATKRLLWMNNWWVGRFVVEILSSSCVLQRGKVEKRICELVVSGMISRDATNLAKCLADYWKMSFRAHRIFLASFSAASPGPSIRLLVSRLFEFFPHSWFVGLFVHFSIRN